MMPKASQVSVHVRLWLPAIVLWTYLAGLALSTTSSRYAFWDAGVLLAIYGLLAFAIWAGAVALATVGRLPAVVAALGLGVVVVWHAREQIFVPAAKGQFVGSVAFVSAGILLLLRRSAGCARPRASLAVACSGGVAFVALLAISYATSTVLRWHILRHNKLIGTPLFLAVGEWPAEVGEALWAERVAQTTVEPPSLPPLPPAGEETPNIVFILIDTLRADAFAAHGGDPDLMPAFNRLADRSILFEDVRANASWTKASVASFFTGLYPEEHGAVGDPDRLAEERVTLAERFSDAGYHTVAFVTNFAVVGKETGFDQGFDEFHEVRSEVDPYARAEQVNRTVRQWVEEALARQVGVDSRPLFLYLHYLDPHEPHLAGGSESGTPSGSRASYDEELRYIDRHIPEFIELLRARLGPEKTWVFVTSDHGEEFGEHGEVGHGHSLYPELVHLPALLLPPHDGAVRVASKLEARDFFALLTEVARSPDFDAASWARRHVRNSRYASQYTSRPVIWHRPYLNQVAQRSFESGDLVLIWSAYGRTTELYDRARDPGELDNLAARRSSDVRALETGMEEQLRYWVPRETGAEHTEENIELLRRLGYVQ